MNFRFVIIFQHAQKEEQQEAKEMRTKYKVSTQQRDSKNNNKNAYLSFSVLALCILRQMEE